MMLVYCKTCGRLLTPHAFQLHRQPICLPLDKQLKQIGLFCIKLDASQIKNNDYPTDLYWASHGMFSGLSPKTIPWEWLKDKGLLSIAFSA